MSLAKDFSAHSVPPFGRNDNVILNTINDESPAFAGLSSFNSKNYFLAGAAGGVVAGALVFVLVFVLPALVFAFIFEVSVFVFSFCLACTGAAVTLPTMIAAANI